MRYNVLTPEQAAAMKDFPHAAIELPHPAEHVEEACTLLSRETVRARIDTLRSQIRTPGLTPEEGLALMQECNELMKMLND